MMDPVTKNAQEWLTYHGFATVIDGEMGPATRACIRAFQQSTSLPSTGLLDAKTEQFLEQPLAVVSQPIDPAGRGLGSLVVAYAQHHYSQRPVEIGGENRGPWVRLYMNGSEGAAYPWCAGFATHILQQASEELGIPMPIPYTWGCDTLAAAAKAAKRFFRPASPADLAKIHPGYLFLVRKGADTYQHVGIVETVNGDTMTTLEGNSNNNGSSDGYEVTRLTRATASKDYVAI